MFKELYEKSLKLASHKSSNFFLAIISFIESSFFPIPPDVMIVPMSIAKKNNYLKIFFIATIFSTLGGMFGYFFGSLFADKAMLIMEFYGYEKQAVNLKEQLSLGGRAFSFWLGTLFLAGFTPLPFKLLTISSGFINFNIFFFIIICVVTRGLRFFLVSFLTYKYGEAFGPFLERYGTKWSIIITFTIILIAGIFYFLLK